MRETDGEGKRRRGKLGGGDKLERSCVRTSWGPRGARRRQTGEQHGRDGRKTAGDTRNRRRQEETYERNAGREKEGDGK